MTSIVGEEMTSEGVLLGPDLCGSQGPLDKKEYRQFILKSNGLRVLLVRDTLALQQQVDCVVDAIGNKDENGDDNEDDEEDKKNNCDDNEYDDEEELNDDSEYEGEDNGDSSHNHNDDDESEDDGEEEDGIRNAAAALVVGAGSFYDPTCAMGLAHFLEHMLFMGTRKYPQENFYDSFLSTRGGTDNAFTELEHTLYHFEIPQEHLVEALDIFAQFFIDPLMLKDAVGRELKAIESEFQLSRNSDECRLQQLLCHTSGRNHEEHPFAKFAWGNNYSLKELPEKNDVNVLNELRKFYDQYYYATNMSLVVMGKDSLDELQDAVIKSFSEIPTFPRMESPIDSSSPKNDAYGNEGSQYPRTWEDLMVPVISPFEKKYGMPFIPSSLGKVFRIVPVKDRHNLTLTWQLPPQAKNWRAKPGDFIAHLLGHEGQGSLLSALKRKNWVTACYAGIGSGGYEDSSCHSLFSIVFNLLEEGVQNWQSIAQYVYTYIGIIRRAIPKGLPSWLFEELKVIHELTYKYADELQPSEFVQEIAESICPFVPLPPDRVLDGFSLLFEFDLDSVKNLLEEYFIPNNSRIDIMSSKFGCASEIINNDVKDYCDKNEDSGSSKVDEAGNRALTETFFGTQYWCDEIPYNLTEEWREAASSQTSTKYESEMSLPPLNPFVPQKYDIKRDEGTTAMTVEGGEMKDEYEEREEKDMDLLNDRRIVPNQSKDPTLIFNDKCIKFWHLLDEKFNRPTAELRLKLVCAKSNKNPFYRACSDLFVLLCLDALTELKYQASVCELESSIEATDVGFYIRVHGFDDKLLHLTKEVMLVFFSFRGGVEVRNGLPSTCDQMRFDSCLEALERKYKNAGMNSSSLATSVRLRCLQSNKWSQHSKFLEVKNINVSSFASIVHEILEEVFVEALFHGNCDHSDAQDAIDLITHTFDEFGVSGLATCNRQSQYVNKVPFQIKNENVLVPSKDATESNTAVEIYFQVGNDDIVKRVMIDLLVQMIYEPLYDQLRSKEQWGYYVAVQAKYTFSVIGINFLVVTASRSVVEVIERIEKFIIDYRETLKGLEEEVFQNHISGLVKNKLQIYNSLEEQCSDLWGEILEGRYDWQFLKNEAQQLTQLKKENVLAAYEEWLYPFCTEGNLKKRRGFVVGVVGGEERAQYLHETENVGNKIEASVQKFHNLCHEKTWDKIY